MPGGRGQALPGEQVDDGTDGAVGAHSLPESRGRGCGSARTAANPLASSAPSGESCGQRERTQHRQRLESSWQMP
jgi:hypothetical protein